MTTAMQRVQTAPLATLEFSAEQRKIILDSFLNGASESEAAVLMELAKIRRLNPITKQIHFVKRWDAQKRAEVWAAQVGIDGFRSIAERTGLYDGQDEPEYEYENHGGVKICRVRVYRKDWSRPSVGVAHYSEYVQLKKEGGPNHTWATKPHIMLAKCAEALAFRKAFPEDTSGLYSPDEMPEERELNSAPAQQVDAPRQSRTERMKETMKAKSAAPATVAPAPASDAWKLILELMNKHGKVGDEAAGFIKESTGKRDRHSLTMDDYATLCAVLEGPPVPLQGDSQIGS